MFSQPEKSPEKGHKVLSKLEMWIDRFKFESSLIPRDEGSLYFLRIHSFKMTLPWFKIN